MGINGQRYWVLDGEPVFSALDAALSDGAEHQRFEREGGVRVTTGVLGTEIKWAAFSPCFASLFRVLKLLETAQSPYILRYYLCGWFEETCDDLHSVRNRIEQVMSKSEMRITRKAFVDQIAPDESRMPQPIRASWTGKEIIPDISIDCIYDHRMQKFRVSRIGDHSTIARIWGAVPVIYPYVNGGSYEDIVTEAYKEVLDSGQSRYDHVLAAMRMPNNTIHWLPYQRVIVPKRDARGSDGVTVVTEVAPVAIRLV